MREVKCAARVWGRRRTAGHHTLFISVPEKVPGTGNSHLILAPTWDCNEFAAHGYGVRPFSDFGWAGKVGKAYAMVRAAVQQKAQR